MSEERDMAKKHVLHYTETHEYQRGRDDEEIYQATLRNAKKREVMNWISCKEKMPEIGGRVLVGQFYKTIFAWNEAEIKLDNKKVYIVEDDYNIPLQEYEYWCEVIPPILKKEIDD